MLRACQLLTPAETPGSGYLSFMSHLSVAYSQIDRLCCLTEERRGIKEGAAPTVSFPTEPPTCLVPTLGAKMLPSDLLDSISLLRSCNPGRLSSLCCWLSSQLCDISQASHSKKNRSGRAEKERGAIFQNIYTHKQLGIKMRRSSFNINANISSGALIMWSNLSREVV